MRRREVAGRLAVFLCLLLLAPFTLSGARASEPRPEAEGIVAILAIDQRSNLRGIEDNASLIDGFLEKVRAFGIPVTIERIDPNRVTPGAIVARIRALDPALLRDRTLLFYYAGHGGTEPARGHFLGTRGGPLFRSVLRAEILAHDPRLALILTDCCSVETRWTAEYYPTPVYPRPSERIARNLLLQHEGLVDINAASYRPEQGIDQVACYSDLAPPGGIFTNALVKLFGSQSVPVVSDPAEEGAERADDFLTWDEAFTELLTMTAREYRRFRELVLESPTGSGRPPIGAVRPEDLRLIAAQRSQDPQAFGALAVPAGGALVRPPDPEAPRPRLGARVRTLSGIGGVEVVDVTPGTPASRVHVLRDFQALPGHYSLRRGDWILFANDVRVRNAREFLDVVATVPPGGTLKLEGEEVDPQTGRRRPYVATATLEGSPSASGAPRD